MPAAAPSLDVCPTAYRELVSGTVPCLGLIVEPMSACGAVLRALQGCLYAQREVRNAVDVVVHLDGAPPTYSLLASSTSSSGSQAGIRGKLLVLSPACASGVPCSPEASSESVPLLTGLEPVLAGSSTEGELTRAAEDLLQKIPELVALKLRELLSSPAARTTEQTATTASKGNKKKNPSLAGIRLAVAPYTVSLSYRNYTMPELLHMTLPALAARHGLTLPDKLDQAVPSGFEQVGHIAHLNLSNTMVPFAQTIGQVIIDCNPTVSIVVNKVESITSVYREFKMDIIGQRESFVEAQRAAHPVEAQTKDGLRDLLLTATVRQHGCDFRVPYNRVYWNSRLSHEHTRLVEMMKPGDVLYDVMGGVGPFAVPAAKDGVLVLLNDLNPASAEYARMNGELNKLPPGRLFCYNLDGREFMNRVLYEGVMGLDRPSDPGARCTGRRHVTMNLPATAVEFLDVFNPVRSPDSPWLCRPQHTDTTPRQRDTKVLIHVYCFSAADDVLADAVRQVEANLGYTLEEKNKECVWLVRDVAPTKRMVCVSFTLPDSLWHSQKEVSVEAIHALTRKRQRSEGEPATGSPKEKAAKAE